MYHDVGFTDASPAELDTLKRQFLRIQTQPFVSFLAVDEGFAMHHMYLRFCCVFLCYDFIENVFVVDDAVLQDLDERASGVIVCFNQKRRQRFLIDVHRARNEAGTGTEGEQAGLQRCVV